MAKKHNKRRSRTSPGVVTIDPNSANKWFETSKTKAPFWKVSAIAPWGKRLRARAESWDQALTIRKNWEEAFQKWKEDNKQQQIPKIVVLNDALDERRLAQAKRAVSLLPKDKTDLPDERYKLDEGIEFALKCHWNPLSGKLRVCDIIPEFLAYKEKCSKLGWEEPGHIQPVTFDNQRKHSKKCFEIFGSEKLSDINSPPRQEQALEEYEAMIRVSSPEKESFKLAPYTKQEALKFLGMMLRWLRKNGRLKDAVNVMPYIIKRTTTPKAMSLAEQQNFLDRVYNSKLAAAGYMRFYLGLRPYSDLKESSLEEEYGLSFDCKHFMVPMDSKTGHRPVTVPPVAAIVFKELLAQNRLYKGIHKEGFYIIHDGHPSSWTGIFGRCGYHVSPTAMRKPMKPHVRKQFGDKQAIDWYRSRYPLRDWNNRQEPGKEIMAWCPDYWQRGMYWVEDYPRHTEISAYCNLTNGALDQAGTRYGNSKEIIRQHYRDFMTLAEAILHYQLLPTALKGKYDWTKIPMPEWSHYRLGDLKPDVLAEIEEKRALFPAFNPEKNYRQRDYEQYRLQRVREWWSKADPETRNKRLAGLTKRRQETMAAKPKGTPAEVSADLVKGNLSKAESANNPCVPVEQGNGVSG